VSCLLRRHFLLGLTVMFCGAMVIAPGMFITWRERRRHIANRAGSGIVPPERAARAEP
jgi:hypothetical protein